MELFEDFSEKTDGVAERTSARNAKHAQLKKKIEDEIKEQEQDLKEIVHAERKLIHHADYTFKLDFGFPRCCFAVVSTEEYEKDLVLSKEWRRAQYLKEISHAERKLIHHADYTFKLDFGFPRCCFAVVSTEEYEKDLVLSKEWRRVLRSNVLVSSSPLCWVANSNAANGAETQLHGKWRRQSSSFELYLLEKKRNISSRKKVPLSVRVYLQDLYWSSAMHTVLICNRQGKTVKENKQRDKEMSTMESRRKLEMLTAKNKELDRKINEKLEQCILHFTRNPRNSIQKMRQISTI